MPSFCFIFCYGQVGGDGAGHFVKMVHNGIEYGDMQVSYCFQFVKQTHC